MRQRVSFDDVAAHRDKADALFTRVRARIQALAPGADVEHVGSTALPDGITKGDLDVQVRVGRRAFDAVCAAMAGWLAPNPGGFCDGGMSFKDDGTDPPLGVHVTIIGGPSDVQCTQRDILRGSAGLRAEYDAIKRRFQGGDMDAYREAKARFFDEIADATRSSRK